MIIYFIKLGQVLTKKLTRLRFCQITHLQAGLFVEASTEHVAPLAHAIASHWPKSTGFFGISGEFGIVSVTSVGDLQQ